ncbi:MAG: hypothetical protein PHF50_03540, partial [Patescibacteria group bacterium]|nr:hypothetical protein [Patescibacteria group bacterium]
ITAYVNTKNLKSGQARIDILDGSGASVRPEVIKQDLGNDWQFQVGMFATGAGNSRIKIKLYSSNLYANRSDLTGVWQRIANNSLNDWRLSQNGNVITGVNLGNGATLAGSYNPANRQAVITSSIGCVHTGTVNANFTGMGGTIICNNDPATSQSWQATFRGDGSVSEGNFYFDDIKIRPALNSKSNWHTTQSCRLYSKTDSLSCDYYEDSGARQKGWYGYCLEYDRAPGDPNACILWYPVDKVKGDGVEEGAGYQGKAPVYYCTEAKALIPVEYRSSHHVGQTGEGVDAEFWIPYQYLWSQGYSGCGMGGSISQAYVVPVAGSTCHKDCVGSTANGSCNTSGWYEYNGSFVLDEADKGIKFYDPDANQLYDDTFAYCTKIVQTVSAVGDNKYWASRVYSGSDWKVQPFGYQYNTAGAPFGSIAVPSTNPYDWDGNTAEGIQPLPVITPNNSGQIGVANPYKIIGNGTYGVCSISKRICSSDLAEIDCASGEGTCVAVDFSGDPVSKLKLLFAKSYGSWIWDIGSSRYLPNNVLGTTWNLPGKCAGNTRAKPTDFCAVAPAISNVKINGAGTSINLTKNGFINLTFNTRVDSNQLPLVMYAVDWGDGGKMVVSGMEMRDRPNENIPHSLYHLYSYWDLKAKANSGVTSISCTAVDGVGQCSLQPKVQVKDNWGWCNGGASINDCSSWISFPGVVVVKEK